jgi:predicted O-methyltransferase YrrM
VSRGIRRKAEKPKTHAQLREELGLKLPEGFTGVFIATPAFGADVCAAYARSLAGTIYALQYLGIPSELFMVANNSLIPNARDTIAAAFALSSRSHMLMIDADIEWHPNDALRLLTDARKHEIVLGTYRRKKEYLCWTIRFHEDTQINQDPDTGCVEIDYGGAGFCMVARTVIEKMHKAFPELKYESGEQFDPQLYALYLQYQPAPGKSPTGEDVAFSRRWQSIGGKIWLDAAIDLKHWGNMVFEGHVVDIFKTPGGADAMAELARDIRPALEIEGWLTEAQALVLGAAARRVKAGAIVELGSWKGRSTAVIGLANKGQRRFVAVDNFNGSPGESAHAEARVLPDGVLPQFLANIAKVGLSDAIDVVVGDSAEATKDHMPPEGVGLLFIDAEHAKDAVLADFRAWEPHLLPGATVIFHDFNWLTVKAALHELSIPVEEVHDMAIYTVPIRKEVADMIAAFEEEREGG